MEGDDFPAVVIGGVSGPGQVGPEPMDAFHGLNFVMSDLPDEGLHLTTRDALGELAMQIGGAVGAGSAVRQLVKLTEELRAQRHSLFRARRLYRHPAFAQPSLPAHNTRVGNFSAEFAPAQV